MSKILVSCATLGHGGAERVLSILSHSFADNYEEVIYLMWLKDEVFYEVDPRVRLVFLSDISGHNNRFRELVSFRKYVKKEKPDLILSFLTPFNMLVQVATLGLGIKTVVCERNDPHYVPGGKITEILRDFTYRWTTGILAQTDYSRNCYKGKLREKTSVIYNPVMMSPEEVGSGLKTKKKNRIISVGRLHSQKNQRMLIDAFSLFVKTHPDYELVVYGEGPLRQELEQHVKNIGIEDKVAFPGHSNAIWNEIKASKIFAMSSVAEGMSNALVEAMCLGVPVVSTKVAGAVDLIKDGENGFLVSQNDVMNLNERMCRIADDNNLAAVIGRKGTEIYDILKVETICSQWITYINNFL